jgi:phage terminase large subunit-like protein
MPSQKQSLSLWPNTSDFATDAIASIEPAGIAEVFDLQIERTGNFIANGLVSHNTRWHEDDLAGRILSSEDGPNWTVVSLPAEAEENDPLGRTLGEALCPTRYDVAALADIRKVLGSYGYAALYQQRPSSPEGGILKRQWWHFWAPKGIRLLPVQVRLVTGQLFECPVTELPEMEEQLQSWDMAFKDKPANDYVVGQVWGRKGADRFLLAQARGQWDMPKTVEQVRALSVAWPAAHAKLVEDKANGPAVIQTLRHEIAGLIAVEPAGGKEARAQAAAPQV